MKHLLFALCFVAILSAITVELSEGTFGSVDYRIEDPDARDSSLTIVVMRENVQHAVYIETDFDGVHLGSFPIIEPGTYTLRAYNKDTGGSGESTITLSPSESSLPIAEAVEEAKEEATEQQTTIELPDGQESWFLYLIVGLVILLIIILLFANPLKKQKKKK